MVVTKLFRSKVALMDVVPVGTGIVAMAVMAIATSSRKLMAKCMMLYCCDDVVFFLW